MNAREALTGLAYVGGAQGIRQTYDVLKGKRHYVVGSMSRAKGRSGNFNLVDAAAVEATQDSFSGQQGITSKDVRQRLARRGISIETLEALNVLYVLVAEGKARVDRRRSSRVLYFNVSA
jgi:hypothetical protein